VIRAAAIPSRRIWQQIEQNENTPGKPMQLLFKRSLKTGAVNVNSMRFVLWVKFDIDADESRLIHKYRAEDAYLTIEQSRRDFYRAMIISFFVAAFLGSIITSITNIGMLGSLLYFICIFVASTWLIYEQLREAIRISDLLTGRNFKSRSLALLMRRERRMVGYAVAFTKLLEAMRTWEGTEIIQIGPEHEPALRLVTDTYAPA
jgi:hypothetical protein